MIGTDGLALLTSSALAGAAVIVGFGRLLPAWDAFARGPFDAQAAALESLGVPSGLIVAGLRVWGSVLAATPIVVGPVLGMYILAPPTMLLVYRAPAWILAAAVDERRRTLRDQLVPFCSALANAARSGLALPQGLEEVSRNLPRPLHGEIRRIVHDYDRGRTIIDAVHDARQRLQLDTFSVFSGVVATCFETGADYTDALDAVGRSLQENQRLERKLAAETASGWTVMMALGAFPFAFLALFYVIDAEGTSRVFSTGVGQCVLAVTSFLTYLSAKSAGRILDIEV
jgi:Flp pilus assembly protein TadB